MTTKFSIGDEVWFMRNNRPECMVICGIEAISAPAKYNTEEGELYGSIIDWKSPTIRYSFWDVDGVFSYKEYESGVYATKRELQEAVFGE